MRAAKPAAALWAGLLLAVACALVCYSSAQALEADGFEPAPPLRAASGGALAGGESQPLDDPLALSAASLTALPPPAGAPGSDAVADDDLAGAAAAAGAAGPGAGAGDAGGGAQEPAQQLPLADQAGASAAAAAATSVTGDLVQGAKNAGDPIPGRYIVSFMDNATTADAIAGVQKRVLSLATLSARKARRASAAAAAAPGRMTAASVGASDIGRFEVEHVLGDDDSLGAENPEIGAAAVSLARPAGFAAASAAPRPRGRPPRGAVLVISHQLEGKAVKRAMRAAPGIAGVIQDSYITIAQSSAAAAPACAAPSFLAGTVAAPSGLDWPGCYVPGVTKVAWFGERCGTYMTGTHWVGMYAFYALNSTLVSGCVRYRSRKDPDPYNTANFGACGSAPAVAKQLPTQLCADAAVTRAAPAAACIPADTLWGWNALMDSPVKCGGASTAGAVYRGMRCGPGMRWVRWSSLTLPDGGKSCRFSRSATDLRFNAQWLGQCGVPPQFNLQLPTRVCVADDVPGNGGGLSPRPAPSPPAAPRPPSPSPAPSPSPRPAPAPVPPSAYSIPKVALMSGEIAHVNMRRILAVANNLVPDFTNLGVSAAVVDTGVDRRHPDLNVVGGKSFVSSDAKSDPYTDGFGHGTHVSGILGAKNNGQGIVGAAPGIPIYSLKVLDSDGTGTTSDLLKAYEWLYYNARALGIRVVNLSLTGGGGETDPQCEWAAALAKQGLTLVAAAGNNKVNLMQEAPGACAKTLVVTSFTDKDAVPNNDAASWFSNFLPSGQLTDARRRRIVAAPGEDIISTYPLDRPASKGLPQGYQSMSGTSMACPHVTGIAARCYASGECGSDTDTEAEAIAGFAKDWNAGNPGYGFTGDAVTGAGNSQYYGYAVYAARW